MQNHKNISDVSKTENSQEYPKVQNPIALLMGSKNQMAMNKNPD